MLRGKKISEKKTRLTNNDLCNDDNKQHIFI